MSASAEPMIRKLDEATVLKIAAGEVVERPACIVKELVENSLDAGATRIELRIQSGGVDEILLQDDGHGIEKSQLPLAITAHATSKLSTIEDLSHVSTLGFRGEALASIAAVSDFSLSSRTQNQSEAFRIDVSFGRTDPIRPDPLEQGTRVEVRSLFMNVPARKKFLKSSGAEKQQVERTFRRISMIHPSVAFRFLSDDKEVFDLPRAKDLQERIAQIYGRDFSKHLRPLSYSDAEVSIQGLVSDKDLHFGRAQEIWLFVNERPIQDRSLQHAILEGYRSALMERRYPFALVRLTVDPSKLDVNIHPRKSEVRFAKGLELFGRLSKAIERTLDRPTATPPIHPPPRDPPTPSVSVFSSFLYDAMIPSVQPAYDAVRSYATEPPPQPKKSTGFFSSLRFLSHVDHTYWVLQNHEAVYLVDQHAAHERVLFEKLRNRSQGLASQALLIPVTLELTPAQEDTLHAMQVMLSSIGFEIEPFGGRTHRIRSIPEFARKRDPSRLLLDLIADAQDDDFGKSIRDAQDRFVSTLACHSAVRAHDALNESEISALLSQMDETRLSSYCPHGRPTFITLDRSALEKMFQRT